MRREMEFDPIKAGGGSGGEAARERGSPCRQEAAVDEHLGAVIIKDQTCCADGSPLEWIAKTMFSWMRPKPRHDQALSDVPELCGLDMKRRPKPKQQSRPKQQQQQHQHQRSSPPKLCTKEESVLQTAPVSTCDSSAASWSEMAVGSSDSSSSAGATHDMVTFHRLSGGVGGGPRRSPPPLTLTVDPDPAPAPSAPPVDIPWTLVDPDAATNPMQEALSHSLAQMELRMSGRHTTKHAPTTSSTSAHYNHRRALSALPISRADAAANGSHARHTAALAAEGRGGEAPLTSFWKQTPPSATAVPSGSFDEAEVPSPRERGACGRARGRGAFEGYFSEDSSAAATTADASADAASDGAGGAVASDSASTSSFFPDEEDGGEVDGDVDVLLSFADGGLAAADDEDDDGDMIFAFDDL